VSKRTVVLPKRDLGRVWSHASANDVHQRNADTPRRQVKVFIVAESAYQERPFLFVIVLLLLILALLS
jgi:hypothetical protein